MINYSNENLKDKLKKLTGGKGVDVCYEIVGGEVFDAVGLSCKLQQE